jgi:DNA-binding NarL/FixJ family response regulator
MSAPSERVRVLIADSNYMGSELMANALSHYRNDFEVVGIASSSHDTLRKVQACKPHVALLSPGWGHGDHTGFRVMQRMRDAHPRTTLVMLLRGLFTFRLRAIFGEVYPLRPQW